jgi:hypothetical protein
MTWTPPNGTSPNPQTLDFIRQLSDGKDLTEDTLMQMAAFLNESREARHSWPGEKLFGFLGEIFATGLIGDVQLDATRKVISSIEREYSLLTAGDVNEQPAVPVDSIWVEDLKLPDLRSKATITDASSRNTFQVDLSTHTCTCGAWYGNRRSYKNGDARLCCAHVAQAFKDELDQNGLEQSPRLFPEMINDIAARYEGLDYRSTWRLLRIQMRPFLISYGHKVDWCTVYGQNAERVVEKFSLHRTELRWSYGRHPQCAASIAAYVKSLHED